MQQKHLWSILILLAPLWLFGQWPDTLALPEVEVRTQRDAVTATTIYEADTQALQTYTYGNLAQQLGQSSPLLPRLYGPAGIATSSLRGGSANHTQLVWNGLPLNQATLGQADLSLLSGALFDAAEVLVGSHSSAAFTTPGGQIRLGSSLPKKKGQYLRLRSIGGSQGLWHGSGMLQQVGKKWSAGVRAYRETATNDFQYRNGLGQNQRLEHAATAQWGVLPQLRYRINDRQSLRLAAWWLEYERELPPTRFEVTSQARQTDRAGRLTLDWRRLTEKNGQWDAKLAYLQDEIWYRDPAAAIDSRTETQSHLAELSYQQPWGEDWSLELAAHARRVRALTRNFAQNPQRDELALFGSILWQGLPKWEWRLQLRQAMVDQDLQPFLPTIVGRYTSGKKTSFGLRLNRHYRLPTFNDLYWIPGGNAELLPERGWSGSLEWTQTWNMRQWQFNGLASAYQLLIDDWIIWLPDGPIFSPVNVQTVNSRGVETKVKARRTWDNLSLQFQARYQYTRSTNQRTKSANDRSRGKQLIYVPLHQTHVGMVMRWPKWRLQYHHQISGAVYVLVDNSEILSAYNTGQLRIDRQLTFSQQDFTIFASVDNIWNHRYEVIRNYPMPGRQFRLGVHWSKP